MPAGRPTEYGPHIIEKVKKYFSEYESTYDVPVTRTKEGVVSESMERQANPPPSVIKFAKYIGVSRETIYNWQEKHPEFVYIFEKYHKEAMKEACVDNGTLGLYNPSFTKFVMQNTVGWSDKTVSESTIKHEFPTEIKISIVTPDGHSDTKKVTIPDNGK